MGAWPEARYMMMHVAEPTQAAIRFDCTDCFWCMQVGSKVLLSFRRVFPAIWVSRCRYNSGDVGGGLLTRRDDDLGTFSRCKLREVSSAIDRLVLVRPVVLTCIPGSSDQAHVQHAVRCLKSVRGSTNHARRSHRKAAVMPTPTTHDVHPWTCGTKAGHKGIIGLHQHTVTLRLG